MARWTGSDEIPDGQPTGLEQGKAAMPGLTTPGQIEEVLQRALTARAPLAGLFEQAPPPSRRQPRRGDVVTYRVST